MAQVDRQRRSRRGRPGRGHGRGVGVDQGARAQPAPPPSQSEAVLATREAIRSQAIVTTRASVLAAVAGLGTLVTIGINYRNSRPRWRFCTPDLPDHRARASDRALHPGH